MNKNQIELIYSEVSGGGRQLINFLRALHTQIIASHVLPEAVGFYERVGFRVHKTRAGCPDYIL